jgi:hypothetical protein
MVSFINKKSHNLMVMAFNFRKICVILSNGKTN